MKNIALWIISVPMVLPDVFFQNHAPYFLIILVYKTNSANLYKYVQLLNHL